MLKTRIIKLPHFAANSTMQSCGIFIEGFPIDSALGWVCTVMTPAKTSSFQIQPFIKFSPKSPSNPSRRQTALIFQGRY